MSHKGAIKRNRKMTQQDINEIISEIYRWESGNLGSDLTWARLEEFSGFTRAALNSKMQIKVAYEKAKKALSKSGKPRIARERDYNNYLEKALEKARTELKEYKEREKGWLIKWQRIAYNIMAKGLVSIEAFDQAIPENAIPPDSKTVENIIRPFEKPLQSKGWS
jgi:hypothetical protein